MPTHYIKQTLPEHLGAVQTHGKVLALQQSKMSSNYRNFIEQTNWSEKLPKQLIKNKGLSNEKASV